MAWLSGIFVADEVGDNGFPQKISPKPFKYCDYYLTFAILNGIIMDEIKCGGGSVEAR